MQGQHLSPDGDGLLGNTRLGHLGTSAVLLLLGGKLLAGKLLGARLAVQRAILLDRAAGLVQAAVGMVQVGVLETAVDAVGSADWARKVGDVLRNGVLAADGAGVDAVALAGLAHGIIAAVKVLAVLEMLGEVVAAAGELAV